MEKKKTVPAALAVMTFLLAAVLAAAAAVHLRQSAGETETGGKTAYFENILFSGQSTVRQVSRTEEAFARDAAFPLCRYSRSVCTGAAPESGPPMCRRTSPEVFTCTSPALLLSDYRLCRTGRRKVPTRQRQTPVVQR